MSKTTVIMQVAVDIPCYMTVHLEVDAELLTDIEKLSAYAAEQASKMYDDDELLEFEPEWEAQSNLRITKLALDNVGSIKVLTDTVAVHKNYHDFGIDVAIRYAHRLHKAPLWLRTIAAKYLITPVRHEV